MPIDWENLSETHQAFTSFPQVLRAGASRQTFAAGETLARRGARPKSMMYLLEGDVRLVRHTFSGDKVILQRARRGFIAEASMEAAAYHCDIEVFEDGQMLAFPLVTFRQALDDNPTFRRSWNMQMAGEIRRLRAANERLHLHKAADRVLHYLESEGINGVVTLTQSRKAWAVELGLTHEALYRTLRRMEHDGVLTVRESRIECARPVAGETS